MFLTSRNFFISHVSTVLRSHPAANALPLPGVLIHPNQFSDKTIKTRLLSIGIEQVVTPTSQFQLSGGSVHCLTNEL